MEALIEFGMRFIQGLQSLSPTIDGLMEFISFLGTIEFYILFTPIFYWMVSVPLGFRLLLLLVTTDFVTTTFKHLFHQPRPYWLGQVKALGSETSYGLPSSHASDSLAVWGYLAYAIQKVWLWIFAIVIVILIGISRLYLGVHFPHDVLVGWLIGLAVGLIFISVDKSLSGWVSGQTLGVQILIGLAGSILAILVGYFILAIISASPDPDAWARFSSQARSPSHYFTLGGALFGGSAGYALMCQRAQFNPGGSWAKRTGRYFLGMIGVFTIYLGLDYAFSLIAPDETALGYLLRYLRYGSLAFWVTFLAPWFFLKIHLAEAQNG